MTRPDRVEPPAPSHPADQAPPEPDRRDLLRRSGVGAATLALAACGGAPSGAPAAVTRRRVRWTLVSSFPASLDAMFGPAQLLGRRLEEMSDGAFTLTPHQAGELVPALEVLDSVQGGVVEVGQTASYYYTGKNPVLAFDTCVPFGLGPRQQQAWLRQGGGLELMREQYADFGLIHFPAGNTGTQMGGWFRQPIGGAGDLKGLRMRIPGLGGQVMAQLGVSVQLLAGGDIYTALEQGRIDATEWVGPYDDEKLGFHKAARNYYYPGWWEPGPELTFVVGRQAWDALPPGYQAMFEAATREAAAEMQQVYDARNPAALARLREAGVEVRPFSDDLLRAAREASEDLLSSEAAKDPNYARVLERWRRFRTDSAAWFGTAELAYARFAWGAS